MKVRFEQVGIVVVILSFYSFPFESYEKILFVDPGNLSDIPSQ